MTAEQIVQIIEEASEDACVEHLGGRPETWYTGGSDHNDDRITARVMDDDRIRISGRSDVCETYHISDFATADEWRELAVEITEAAWYSAKRKEATP